MNTKGFYTIRYVSRRTGLSPHVIRAWEKRYKAVVPQRSSNNRRLYSDAELQRLQLLKKITDAGHSISLVAKLESPELLKLAQREGPIIFHEPNRKNGLSDTAVAKDYCNKCLFAVLKLDPDQLENIYDKASVDLSITVLLKDIIVPLFEEIGKRWAEGSLRILNEHMATSVTRTFLLNILKAADISESAPRIVIATTVGQWHDLGALTIAVAACQSGWRPLYFGPNLPAEEITAAVKQSNALAVAVSIAHLIDQRPLNELRKLRRYVSKDVALFVGGRAVKAHTEVLKMIHVKFISGLDQIREELDLLLRNGIGHQ
jgi:DNA-binding transcriptional MerR regulator/methanogenic corrinoid protein MtbC1